MLNELKERLLNACSAVGIEFKEVNSDGRWYRSDISNDPRGKKDASIKIFADGNGAVVKNWKTGETASVSVSTRTAKQIESTPQTSSIPGGTEHSNAAKWAREIWDSGDPDGRHEYLKIKGINPCGTRLYQGRLLIPVILNGEIQSLQFIFPDGQKRFLKNGKLSGGYFTIGDLNSATIICIVEGFATGASVYMATSYPVVVAFNAGNLETVAASIRTLHPSAMLIICVDDDVKTEGNPGVREGTKAADAVHGVIAMPEFGDSRPDNATDFNDLMLLKGSAAVAACVDRAKSMLVAPVAVAGWPDPSPIAEVLQAEPYPIDAHLTEIRAALQEVAGVTQAPIALVASCALSSLSLAGQGLVDVKRAEKLLGPSSLFLLTIADSGERKSTCDTLFITPIREYVEQQRAAAQSGIGAYQAEMYAWEAKLGGLKEKVKQYVKDGQRTNDLELALHELELIKPRQPRWARLLYSDVTPEALAASLATNWPSAGVVSSEAGLVFGAHGMNQDSVMRNLAQLNALWDGATLQIDRKTTGSFTVSGARLTMALQVQGATIKSFFKRTGDLARGTGFLARFFLSWPESTQGLRAFREPPENWPALGRYQERILSLLRLPHNLTKAGTLEPTLLCLSPEAKAAWIIFHDLIERELGAGGELHDVRDVASKAADNAARLAALFHLYANGLETHEIGVEVFEAATRIVAWHLSEARRFLNSLSLSQNQELLIRLDEWLVQVCQRENKDAVPFKQIQQFGPAPLRDGASLESALKVLQDLGRVRVVTQGRKRLALVNPQLLHCNQMT